MFDSDDDHTEDAREDVEREVEDLYLMGEERQANIIEETDPRKLNNVHSEMVEAQYNDERGFRGDAIRHPRADELAEAKPQAKASRGVGSSQAKASRGAGSTREQRCAGMMTQVMAIVCGAYGDRPLDSVEFDRAVKPGVTWSKRVAAMKTRLASMLRLHRGDYHRLWSCGPCDA